MKIRYTKGPGAEPAPATLTLNELDLVKGKWADCTPAEASRAAPFVNDYGIEFKDDPAPVDSPVPVTE